MSLGAFTQSAAVERLYETVDLMLVVGSHLRSNETRTYAVKLPEKRLRIDADPSAADRGYSSDMFLQADAAAALTGLVERLAPGSLAIDPAFAGDLAAARDTAEAEMCRDLGPYAAIDAALARQMPPDALWVRDITLMNSLWGNRAPRLPAPRRGIHAMGGGIGQGLPMAVGAALAAPGRKVVALIGDGGLALSLGELATAVETRADIVLLLMNDAGYGVIRNIQDAHYGGRRCYTELQAPDFGLLAESLGLPYRRVRAAAEFAASFAAALTTSGPSLLEIDLTAIGSFARQFAGPPGSAGKR